MRVAIPAVALPVTPIDEKKTACSGYFSPFKRDAMKKVFSIWLVLLFATAGCTEDQADDTGLDAGASGYGGGSGFGGGSAGESGAAGIAAGAGGAGTAGGDAGSPSDGGVEEPCQIDFDCRDTNKICVANRCVDIPDLDDAGTE